MRDRETIEASLNSVYTTILVWGEKTLVIIVQNKEGSGRLQREDKATDYLFQSWSTNRAILIPSVLFRKHCTHAPSNNSMSHGKCSVHVSVSLTTFIHITSLVSIVVYCYGSVCKLLRGVNGGGSARPLAHLLTYTIVQILVIWQWRKEMKFSMYSALQSVILRWLYGWLTCTCTEHKCLFHILIPGPQCQCNCLHCTCKLHTYKVGKLNSVHITCRGVYTYSFTIMWMLHTM